MLINRNFDQDFSPKKIFLFALRRNPRTPPKDDATLRRPKGLSTRSFFARDISCHQQDDESECSVIN